MRALENYADWVKVGSKLQIRDVSTELNFSNIPYARIPLIRYFFDQLVRLFCAELQVGGVFIELSFPIFFVQKFP